MGATRQAILSRARRGLFRVAGPDWTSVIRRLDAIEAGYVAGTESVDVVSRGHTSLIAEHSRHDYRRLVDRLLRELPEDVAVAAAVGSPTLESFRATGDVHVSVLRSVGLKDGMTIYDLGCGSGRTAQALMRAGWQGLYLGHDINEDLVRYLNRTCGDFRAQHHEELSLLADSETVDIVFHWSVFTHLYLEESWLYLLDTMRVLKPGGYSVFSFLEIEDADHFHKVFLSRVDAFRTNSALNHLDTFMGRSQISVLASRAGLDLIRFEDGTDSSLHPGMWQSLCVLQKPHAPGTSRQELPGDH